MNDQNQNILQELTFVPDWARQPAGGGVQVSVTSRSGTRPERRPDQRSGPRSPRYAGRPPGADGRGRSHNPAHADAARMRTRSHAPGDSEEYAVPAPCRINFIPERRGLKPLVLQLGRTRRAWLLNEVARMFLSKPEFYAVKIETLPPREGVGVASGIPATFSQCAECHQVFQTREAAVAHVMRRHFSLFFDMEEQPGEPPKGNFASVARCGLSGTLLGPPNYHLYNEKIQELHRERFPGMPMDVYRRHIVNETDPAIVEKWKQEVSTQTVYRTKREPEPQTFNRRSEAESFLMATHVAELIRDGQRFIVPGTVASDLEDQALQRAIKQVWLRETRVPLRITLAVRPAFKQLGLHVFRMPDKSVFVSAVAPRPLGGAQATPEVTFIITHLTEHPGLTAAELAQAWADAGGVPEAIGRELHWLVDKGHVIEFFDGKMTVPPETGERKPEDARPKPEDATADAAGAEPAGSEPAPAPGA